MPTVADVKPLAEILATIALGTPLTHGALTVVPLLAPGRPEPDWLTLGEADDAVTVTEVSEAGAVPALRVANASDRPVLLLDGEELIGAKQNRALNTTVLAAARAATTIPVSCVEAGRWAYRTRRFAASAHSLFASVRQSGPRDRVPARGPDRGSGARGGRSAHPPHGPYHLTLSLPTSTWRNTSAGRGASSRATTSA